MRRDMSLTQKDVELLQIAWALCLRLENEIARGGYTTYSPVADMRNWEDLCANLERNEKSALLWHRTRDSRKQTW